MAKKAKEMKPRKQMIGDPKVTKISETQYSVQSFRNPLEVYSVSFKRGVWACTCPHFTYHCAGLDVDCKHITLVKEKFPEARAQFFACPTVSHKALSEMF